MITKTQILIVTALLAVPAASAGWAGKGIHEPDTARDVADGFVPLNPDQSATSGRNVYFNAFSTQSIGVAAEIATSVNPNVATLQTGYITSSGRAYAMMGVWKDCNKDGFVGWGDQGLFEYRTTLLSTVPGPVVCPAEPLPASIPRDWIPSHNDGAWVREWIPIGYDQTANTLPNGNPIPDNNPFNLNDVGARVWWDWGLPESPTRTRCYAFPVDGTFHSTGGLVEYADCFVNFKATDAYNAVAPDNTAAGQLSFRDQPRDQSESTSRANVANPWGEESDQSHVVMFDCSQRQIHHQRIPNTDTEIGISQPRAPDVRTQGSIGGTMNETATAFDDCDRSDNKGEWEHSMGALPYGLEEDIIATKTVKQQTGYTLRFNEGFRTPNLIHTNPGNQVLGRGTPRDLGTRATEPEGFWVSSSRIGESYNPLIDRETQGPQAVTYVTAYGSISSEAISKYSLKLLHQAALYGSEHCNQGVPTTGEWECDPDKWWRNPDGSLETRTTTDTVAGPATFIGAKVNDPYVVRDIDCYDFSAGPLREQGIHWGALTTTACVRPS